MKLRSHRCQWQIKAFQFSGEIPLQLTDHFRKWSVVFLPLRLHGRGSLAALKAHLPQALRVIIPPLTSQYLNLTKNSSLAVAVGYQDIVSIANTTLNQTGQAIESIALIMLVFLTISLGISLFMNWYNARVALVER